MIKARQNKGLSSTVLQCFLLLAMNGREPTCLATIQAKGDYLTLKIRGETLFLKVLPHSQVQRIHQSKQLLLKPINLYFILNNYILWNGAIVPFKATIALFDLFKLKFPP